VTECNWIFNSHYAKDYSSEDYYLEIIRYVREVEDDFEQRNYDPDGAGGGTITDVINALKDCVVITD